MPRVNRPGRHQRARAPFRSAKQRAWRKNRRFGQAHHGDAVGRAPNYIPAHALPEAARSGAPVLVENRPHHDYFFPASGDEVLARLRQLPPAHTEGITHIWLRRMGPKAREREFGSYNPGPGYAVIVLYPWPRSLFWRLGQQKPSLFWRQLATTSQGTLERTDGIWYLRFTEEGARRCFLDDVLLHEVGHHHDKDCWRRGWRKAEEFAIQYASEWARKLAAMPAETDHVGTADSGTSRQPAYDEAEKM